MPTRDPEAEKAFRKAERKIKEARRTGAKELHLSVMGLTELPESLGQLTQLQSLHLSSNQLTALPESLGQLTQLQTLDLFDNQLTALPESLGQLTQLQTLDLSHNQLTALPESLGQLTQLQSLNLYHNQLTALPESLGQLTQLQTLNLSHNQLTALPESLGQLTQLQTLHLTGNRLTALPESLGQLTQLQTLDLDHNQLTALPESLGQLTQLQTLDLSHNQLTALPESLGQLTQLQTLNLSGNRLTALPEWLGNLAKLQMLTIKGNPLPEEILKLSGRGDRGKALLIYLQAVATGKKPDAFNRALRLFNEAKLLFIGQGNVGKTWLLEALQGRKPRQTASTKGMEIAREPLPVAHPEDSKRGLQLNCWDFGGQEHYQITHQIFFSAKAVYLLVWKPRNGVDPDLAEKLERIELSAGRTAKVLIVSTHADGNVPAVIGKDALKERFGDLIWGFYETDSEKGRDGTGIAELKAEIAKATAQLEGMDLPFPPSWHAAQQKIRKIQRPTIAFCEFVEVCATQDLDAVAADSLAAIMEVQGHTVFFADAIGDRASGMSGSENLVVLNPEWLAKAVGFVIEDRETRSDSGLLQHARLAKIWKRDAHRHCPGYGKELHGYLLWMMWKFDIAYRQNEHTSLVPELIQRNRPDDLRWTPAARARDPEVTLVCRVPQQPPVGLIPALTAAVHPLRRVQNPDEAAQTDQLDRNWRDGFFLDTALRGTAFVELQDRDLRIVVRDKYPSDLCGRVEKTLGEITKVRWPRLEMDLRVPCIGKAGEKPCRGTFRKSRLEQWRSKRLPCEECGNEVDADMMLQGFDAREEEVMEQLRSLRLGQQELKDGQHELMAASFRFFQQALDPARRELERAPCMLTIIPDKAKSWQLLSQMTENLLRVTCWCEHPDGPHPAAKIGSDEPPDYLLKMPKGWVTKVAPYISWAGTLLKAFVPLAGAAVQQVLGEFATPEIKDHIALMNATAGAVPSGKMEVGERDDLATIHRMRPEIVALRRVHDALLAQVPAEKRWGDLRPVSTKSGELLWLCPKHAAIQQPPVQNL